MKKSLLPILFIFSSFLHSQTTYYVPADFSSIQSAIDASENGDQIIVSPGTYFENIDYNGKNIEVASNYILDNDQNIINTTIIDGDSLGRVVQMNNCGLAKLNGFTITNGADPGGAGIYTTSSTIELKNLVITQNTASDDGGGIHCHDSDMILENTIVSSNTASVFGGGVFIENDSQVEIINCNINNNTANSVGSSGGGVYITDTNDYNKDVSIICTQITNNNGSGITSDNSTLSLNNVVITENTQIGMALGETTNITADNTYIVNNNEELISGQAFDLYSYGSTGSGFSNSVVGLITNSGAVPGEGNSSNCFGCTETSENATTQALISCVVTGCTNTTACNYNSSATEDDGSCVLLNETCDTCSEDGLSVLDNDLDNDGVCDINEVAGCTDLTACNFNVGATEDDGSCEFIGQVTISGETETCEESVLLEAIGGPYDSYQWYLDGDIINNENQTTISATESGNYKIEVENGNINNYSINFEGNYQHITTSVLPTDPLVCESGPYSVHIKVNPDSFYSVPNQGHAEIISSHPPSGFGSGWSLSVHPPLSENPTAPGFAFSNGGGTSLYYFDESLETGLWYDIIITYNPSTQELILYINGDPVANDNTGLGEITCNDIITTLGKRPGEGEYQHSFDGKIDNYSFWSKCLSEEEVGQYYNCPPTGIEENILVYCPMEEQGTALIYDQKNVTYYPFFNMNTATAWSSDAVETNCATCLSSEEINITINNCGCTDFNADNFDSTADLDNGTCEYLGCTDSNADNFDSNANVDDGSCEYLGCTDSNADNFDSTANVDDGSCEYLGCTDSNADNFDSTANVDDGSCAYLGCTDSSACNFDSTANTDDGSCQLCASREFNDGSYLDVDSEIINAQGITISFWVNDNDFCANPEDFATYIDFGSQDSYRYVIRNRSCKIEAFFEGDMLPTEFDWGTMDWGYPTASAAGGIGPQSGWRQITAVFCPTTIRLYVSNEDGTNLVASNGTGVYFSQGFNLFAEDVKRIGFNQVDYEPANAMIDEVRIWNRALSGEEISARAGLITTLNIDEELNLNGYWQMDCENPFLNEVTGQLGVDNLSVVNENFNNNSCETDNNYDYTCPVDLTGIADCNSCDPPEGCTDEEACNYDYLAVVSIPDACFYITDYCPDLEYPEYYDCDCKCINDSDSDDVCDEIDNCPDVYNPDQFDFNDDGIGDACDDVGLEEGGVAKELIKVTDVLGREIQKETKGSTLMYWYNTGEVEIIYNFK